jgi:hypothetical protein
MLVPAMASEEAGVVDAARPTETGFCRERFNLRALREPRPFCPSAAEGVFAPELGAEKRSKTPAFALGGLEPVLLGTYEDGYADDVDDEEDDEVEDEASEEGA